MKTKLRNLLSFLIFLLVITTYNCVDSLENKPTDLDNLDKDKIALDYNDFVFSDGDSANSITQDFKVPIIGENGSLITWSCNSVYIDINTDGLAKIIRSQSDSNDIDILCTAKISENVYRRTK